MQNLLDHFKSTLTKDTIDYLTVQAKGQDPEEAASIYSDLAVAIREINEADSVNALVRKLETNDTHLPMDEYALCSYVSKIFNDFYSKPQVEQQQQR